MRGNTINLVSNNPGALHQFRLILEFVGKSEEKVVRVCGIEDYH